MLVIKIDLVSVEIVGDNVGMLSLTSGEIDIYSFIEDSKKLYNGIVKENGNTIEITFLDKRSEAEASAKLLSNYYKLDIVNFKKDFLYTLLFVGFSILLMYLSIS